MSTEIIDYIRERSAEGNFDLPPLVSEPSRFKSVWELILEILEPILAPFFEGAGLAIELVPFGVIFKYGMPVVLLLIIGYLAFLIFRNFRGRTRSVAPDSGELHNGAILGLNLDQQILHALNDADYGLALRLRWRAFLDRQGILSGVTPREFNHSQQISPALITRWYAGMFSRGAATRTLFEELDSYLSTQAKANPRGLTHEG